MKIIGIGDLVADYYYEDEKFKGICGGMSVFNIISHLAKWHQVYAYGVCGTDIEGNICIKSLKDLHVNIDYVERVKFDTRCFYVSINTKDGETEFKSKKSCPLCGEKKWYDATKVSKDIPEELISKDSMIVIDTVNKVNMDIITRFKKLGVKVAIDIGQIGNLKYLRLDEIEEKFKLKFNLVQLNERVAKFLLSRFKYTTNKELQNIFNSDLLVVTHGKRGATFIYDNKERYYDIKSVVHEVDPSGAGDSFFAVIINNYIHNNFKVDEIIIDKMFKEASLLSAQTIGKIGARSVMCNLYNKPETEDKCICGAKNKPKRVINKRKRTLINISYLEDRVLRALESDAYNKVKDIFIKFNETSICTGTGGSKGAACYASKVINQLNGSTAIFLNPRDIIYRNNKDVKNVIAFSYSGTSADILSVLQEENKKNKYIITKGNKEKVLERLPENVNVISYANAKYISGKERGFLSFEGAVASASIFAKLYFNQMKENQTFEEFIHKRFEFWENHFKHYFENEKDKLERILDKKGLVDIFTGDFTETAVYDLESKIVESGIYRVELHEKKDFSHGRFITLENFEPDAIIYLKTKNISKYEEQLLKYLKKLNDKLIIIETIYDGLIGEFDLLIAVQYLICNISKLLNIDLSKPEYSKDSMRIYKFKGKL